LEHHTMAQMRPHLRSPDTSIRVSLKDGKTGTVREVKVGWSWTLFLFSGLFGLPLFLRRFPTCGFVFLALWAVGLLGPLAGGNVSAIVVLLLSLFVLLHVFLGIKGNEMILRNYLEQGWRFAEPDSDAAQLACRTLRFLPAEKV